MNCFNDRFRGSKVLVTGHTGFKGAWLSEWLIMLGAEVTGLALTPPTSPALFDQLELAERLDHRIADIRNLDLVKDIVETVKPDFVFHLAAQPLVRLSYQEPVETYATNVMGTAHLLEAVRLAGHPCAVVVVTTDKCYDNREWVHGYREDDPMGGHDPYSSSKGAAELVVSAFRRSFFSEGDSCIRLASARAGNVIGGGDWATDRIVPDCIRALQQGQTISVRNKRSTRPWQHVLEPLSGYLLLGASLNASLQSTSHNPLASSFNFGPALSSNRSVADLVEEIIKHFPGHWSDHSDPSAVHEATLLNLATDKAFHFLKWAPVWDFQQTVEKTISWYRQTEVEPTIAGALTVAQISAYAAEAKRLGIPWAD